jgi:hypothetical protein
LRRTTFAQVAEIRDAQLPDHSAALRRLAEKTFHFSRDLGVQSKLARGLYEEGCFGNDAVLTYRDRPPTAAPLFRHPMRPGMLETAAFPFLVPI